MVERTERQTGVTEIWSVAIIVAIVRVLYTTIQCPVALFLHCTVTHRMAFFTIKASVSRGNGRFVGFSGSVGASGRSGSDNRIDENLFFLLVGVVFDSHC